MNKETISKHVNWVLYNEAPEGYKMDKHTGSPVSGYDFYTDGKSILNGGKRILVKSHASPINNILPDPPLMQYRSKEKELKQDPMKCTDTRKKVNTLARDKFKVKLLEEIKIDLIMCELEGWDAKNYINELKSLIDDLYRKTIKKKKRGIDTMDELELKFDD